jgi:long-chain acyl-CoA synthetase
MSSGSSSSAAATLAGDFDAAELPRTYPAVLARTAARYPDVVACRTPDDRVSLTWSEFERRSHALAAGLAELGLGRGETAAIMLANRPEFHLTDMAVSCTGATAFSMYNTLPAEQIAYLLENSGARIAICERAFLDRILEGAATVATLEHVVLLEGDGPSGVLDWGAIERAGKDGEIRSAIDSIAESDVITLIYTSGTTGPPKGVELTHRNIISMGAAMNEVLGLGGADRVVSYLPAAHIGERQTGHYMPILYGGTITCCGDMRQVGEVLAEVRPHWFFAVPRIFEKLKAGVEAQIVALGGSDRERAERALAAGLERVRAEQRGESASAALAEELAAADEQLFGPIRSRIGLDVARSAHGGGAPVPAALQEFFNAIGVPMGELWGMSENSGAGTMTPRDRVKIGRAGPAVPWHEASVADDGELLFRGPGIMAGYRGMPEQTAEAVDGDGWLHTGDIAEIDADGYVRIVDRKKEIIISSAGKNMSPANIEAEVKAAGQLIGQVCVIGDRRAYNTALLVPDPEMLAAWAAAEGLESSDMAILVEHPTLVEAVQGQVDRANQRLARVEQIRRFEILGEEWAPGGIELTPTAKLKRKAIAERHAATIEALYDKTEEGRP